jgi:tetratricopeptide (TPR) repeat protein
MKPGKTPKKAAEKPANQYWKYLAAALVIVIVAIAAVLLIPHPSPPLDDATRFQQAGALYSKSVDLANAGNYNEALSDADQALALNATSLIPLIEANRAGILVALGRNTDAIAAADVALAAKGNLTSLQSIAWLNKGNAFCNLGMTSEAKQAYANATALDPTLLNQTPAAPSPCSIQS